MIYYQTPPFGEHILKTMHTKVVPMETKGEKNRSHASSFLICTLLVCCMLLAASGVTFALYTVRELAQLKAQLHHQEKVIESLQGTSTSPDVQSGDSVAFSSRKRRIRSIQTHSEESQQADKAVSESIHLEGDGTIFKPTHHSRVNKWRIVHQLGELVYQRHHGTVKIAQPGYYFVYSQVYCDDGTPLTRGHATNVNRREVMKSASIDARKNLNQHVGYQGGVFKLKTGDQVFISVPCKKKFLVNPGSSYFGLFRVK